MGAHVVTCVFFFNDTATTEIYTLSLHDALPISEGDNCEQPIHEGQPEQGSAGAVIAKPGRDRRHEGLQKSRKERRRSEEHTSELQSRQYLVCRLLLEKKKKNFNILLLYSYALYL